MRSPVIVLDDSSEWRFCYGHRRLESLDSFKGTRTRCMEALEKLKLKRRRERDTAAMVASRREVGTATAMATTHGFPLPLPLSNPGMVEQHLPQQQQQQHMQQQQDQQLAATFELFNSRNQQQQRQQQSGAAQSDWGLTWSRMITVAEERPAGGVGVGGDEDVLAGWLVQPQQGGQQVNQQRGFEQPGVHAHQDEPLGAICHEAIAVTAPSSAVFSPESRKSNDFSDDFSVKMHCGLSADLVREVMRDLGEPPQQQQPGGGAGAGAAATAGEAAGGGGEGEGGGGDGERASFFNDPADDAGAEPHWKELDYWTERWLTRGSVVMHTFSLGKGGGDGGNGNDDGGDGDRAKEIDRIAKRMAAGRLFEICKTSRGEGGGSGSGGAGAGAGADGDGEEPPIFISKFGLTVRVHRDGTTTPMREIDPRFRLRTSTAWLVTCCSSAVRFIDVTVPGVPPGVKFEGRFHQSTLLTVEELARRPSAPAAPATTQEGSAPFSVNSAGGETKEDVRLRVHLPRCPVGVARVEAVWSDGPCRNMNAGAGFPILLVPDANIASEMRTRLSMLREDGEPELWAYLGGKVRGFVQRVGYALQAGLVRSDPDSMLQLSKFYGAARGLDLPLLCELIAYAVDRLDQALEQREVDEMFAEEEVEEEAERMRLREFERSAPSSPIETGENNAHIGAAAEKRGTPTAAEEDHHQHYGGGDDQAMTEKPWKRSGQQQQQPAQPPALSWIEWCVRLASQLIAVPPNFLMNVRPGIVMTAIFFSRAAVDYQHLLIYLLSFFVLDMILLPRQVFSPVVYLSGNNNDGVSSGRNFVNERMYKAATFYAGTFALLFSSKPMMDVKLTLLFHEPESVPARLFSLYWLYSRIKVFYQEPITFNELSKSSRLDRWKFYFVVLFPGFTYSFYYVYALKYGHLYVTSENPMISFTTFLVQLTCWEATHIVGMKIGSHLGAPFKSNCDGGGGGGKEEEMMMQKAIKASMVRRLLHSMLAKRVANRKAPRLHAKIE